MQPLQKFILITKMIRSDSINFNPVLQLCRLGKSNLRLKVAKTNSVLSRQHGTRSDRKFFLVLLGAIASPIEQQINHWVWIHPTGIEIDLTPKLKLGLLAEAEVFCQEVQSRSQGNYIWEIALISK